MLRQSECIMQIRALRIAHGHTKLEFALWIDVSMFFPSLETSNEPANADGVWSMAIGQAAPTVLIKIQSFRRLRILAATFQCYPDCYCFCWYMSFINHDDDNDDTHQIDCYLQLVINGKNARENKTNSCASVHHLYCHFCICCSQCTRIAVQYSYALWIRDFQRANYQCQASCLVRVFPKWVLPRNSSAHSVSHENLEQKTILNVTQATRIAIEFCLVHKWATARATSKLEALISLCQPNKDIWHNKSSSSSISISQDIG